MEDFTEKARRFDKGHTITKQGPNGPVEYELFQVVDEYHDSLSTPTIPWDFKDPPGDLNYICMSLVATMLKHNGIGLAANQCDLPYRIFVMGSSTPGASYIDAVINPVILETTGEDIDQEGCLSYPGVFLKIKRPYRIKVKYNAVDGSERETEFEGLTARVFQHETDHLNGVRFTEHVSAFDFQRAKGKAKANVRKQKKAVEKAVRQMKMSQRLQQAAAAVPVPVQTAPDGAVHIDGGAGPEIVIK